MSDLFADAARERTAAIAPLPQRIRPRSLAEYIGQDRVREQLQVSIAAAKQRGEALDHVLLY